MFKLARYIANHNRPIAESDAGASNQRVALLLAGGDGTRLQELTREVTGVPIPKQYCRLLHGRSLLEATLSRVNGFTSPKRTMAIVNQDHLALARDQLRSLPESSILVQPFNRDTGPGMIFALSQIARTYPNATVAVFPTDHYIDDDHTFMAHVLRATCVISTFPDKIALLGIVPDRPETAYGYIMPAQPLQTTRTPWSVFHVEVFREKPDTATAQDLIARGGLWNTFVMVFQAYRMLELLKALAPPESAQLFELPASPDEVARLYRGLTPWNFSTRVLARIPEHLIILKVDDVHWNDWGTRESVERTYRHLNLVPAWQQTSAISAC